MGQSKSITNEKLYASKEPINLFEPMADKYILCVNNSAQDENSRIRVLKLSSGKFKPTNALLPGKKVKITMILPTEEPWKFYLSSDQGL